MCTSCESLGGCTATLYHLLSRWYRVKRRRKRRHNSYKAELKWASFRQLNEEFDDNLFAFVSKQSLLFSGNLRRGKNSLRSCSNVNQTRFDLIFLILQPFLIQHASNWSWIINGIFLKNQTNQFLEDSSEFIEYKRNHGGICLETYQIWLKYTSNKQKEMQLRRNQRIKAAFNNLLVGLNLRASGPA